MDQYDIYQVGGRLWSLRKLLRSEHVPDDLVTSFQRLDQLVSTVAVQRSLAIDKGVIPERDPDAAFLARILLGILQRGHASFVSPFLETSLLAMSDKYDPDTVCPVLDHQMVPCNPRNFAGRLMTHLISVEDKTKPDWTQEYGSSSERRFLEQPLTELLGPGVGIVEAQRPISTMIEDQSHDEFVHQRVDFALETPTGTKIVFEVDGLQHGNNRAQSLLDRKRDAALHRNGWITERISTRDIRNGTVRISESIQERVKRDPILSRLRAESGELDLDQDEDELAFRVAIAPHAIARIHLAILLAMLEGHLDFKASHWRIGVIERDLPCAELATIDIIEQITHLGAMYGIRTDFDVELVICPEYSETSVQSGVRKASSPGTIETVTASDLFAKTRTLDLLIDVSVRTRAADIRLNDPLPHLRLAGLVPMYEMRSAYRRAPERFMEWPSPRPIPDPEVLEQPLRYFMQFLFRKSDFREKQLDVMKRALQRKDVLGLLPTGGGKSLTFQLPTLLSPGVTVVVAPLKSLIDDQWDNLNRAGINRAAAIHSGHTIKKREQVAKDIVSGYPRFVYIAPERFHIKKFREQLQQSPISKAIAFVVVDEAHCVSEWGHDFRPSYLSVSRQARSLFRSRSGSPPILALTATASTTVLVDIVRELDFDQEDSEARVSVTGFERKELAFLPIPETPATKKIDLQRTVETIALRLGCSTSDLFANTGNAGVIFCRYVNGQFGVVGVEGLMRKTGLASDDQVRFYAGGRPRSWDTQQDWEEYKRITQRGFKDDKFSVLVATSSFGMGIDKQNIRYTVHYGIPHSLEALAQEAGRAGRDKKDSICAIVFTDEDISEDENYLAPNIDVEEARARAEKVSRRDQGDASRLMFLHGISYPGVQTESSEMESVLAQLASAWETEGLQWGEQTFVTLRRPWKDSEQKSFDKALYRLMALEPIVDYTIDYNAGTVEIRTERISPADMENALRAFVRRYDAIERAAPILGRAIQKKDASQPYAHVLQAMCEFSYDVIEKSRREGIMRVVTYLRQSNGDGNAFAAKLHAYLATNTFTGRVAEITKRIEIDEWFSILGDVYNVEFAIHLVNASERELESNPTHAGLHVLAGLGNVQRDSIPPRTIAERLITGLENYQQNYGKSEIERRDLTQRVVKYIAKRRPDRLESIIAILVDEFTDDYTARAAYPYVSEPDLKRRCALPWLRQARDTARSLREGNLEVTR